MNIRETFLKLTQYTVPHGKEDTLREYLPDGVERDQFGNYHMSVGQSETLFTCHLDTVSREVEKVNHVIKGDIVKTDGTTILGGDNKTGVVILMNMIEHNVPGDYWFFAGEEPTAKDGGLYGSKNALKANPEYFKRFKRAVCFDRKHEGSIVIRQMARYTCSNEFVDALMKEFSNQGLEYRPDETGYYTDTAVFINVIPEVTNLSSGTYKEHSVNEYVDLAYLERVANAAIQINWEELPSVRVPKKETSRQEQPASNVHKFNKFKNLKSDRKIWFRVDRYMDMFGFLCLNDDEFEPGQQMIYSRWHKEVRLLVKVLDGIIYINDEAIGNLREFERHTGVKFQHKVDLEAFMDMIDTQVDIDETEVISAPKLMKILTELGSDIDEFTEYYNSKDCEIRDQIKFDSKTKKLTVL